MPEVNGQGRANLRNDPPEVGAASASPPAVDENGVDLTLIRWFLTLRPLDRIRYASRTGASLGRLRVRSSAP